MTSLASDRLGRATSSPPQFGHLAAKVVAQASQNVHSNEQMRAPDCSARRSLSQHSQRGFQRDNLHELEQLFKFFDDPPAPLDDIEPLNIRQYLDWRKAAKVRANRKKALFSHIWNFARIAAMAAHPDLAEHIREFQFRDLRAKAGTDKEESGGLDAAKDQLGHASALMTAHYVRHRKGKLVKPTK